MIEFHSATVDGQTRIGVLKQGKFWYLDETPNHPGYWSLDYTDLRPAQVVKEGQIVIDLAKAGTHEQEIGYLLRHGAQYKHEGWLPSSQAIFDSFAEQIAAQLNPIMDEPKEPANGSVVHLFRKWGIAWSDGEPDGGLNWKCSYDNEFHTWKEILAIDPNPEIIYSPRRIEVEG